MIAKLKRSLWVGGIAVIALGAMMAITSMMTRTTYADPSKIVVCKYTDQGVDERLKTGNEGLVVVSDNTLKHTGWKESDGFPWMWVDAQDRSIAIGYDVGQTAASCPAPTNPPTKDPTITYGEWTDGRKDCEDKVVIQTRTKTVVTHTYVWQNGQWVLVDGTPVVTTQTQTRPMTDAEIKDCTPMPTREPSVVYGEWVDGAKSCEEGVVSQSRVKTTTTYTYTWENGQWVEHATPAETIEHGSRPMTQEELAECVLSEEDDIAPVSVTTIKPTCDTGEKLQYAFSHATVVEGSTANGAEGPRDYEVSFKADEGFTFDEGDLSEEGTVTTFTGTLAGPTDDCGEVLSGETPTTPTPMALPNTAGEAGVAVIVGASLLASVLGVAGIRRLTSRGL